MKTAILVDGGFYRKRAYYLFGDKTPFERAEELISYCHRHLYNGKDKARSELYRIFYYDCMPSQKNIYNPLTQKSVDLSKTDEYKWSVSFFEELKSKRKTALRMGELSDSTLEYMFKPGIIKKLCRKEITVDDLTEADLRLNIQQKGVDMKIGLDISSLAYKRQVDQIVLISGDSDFVPAAKHARREGIDFILDPLHQQIKASLNEHIDGKRTHIYSNDPLKVATPQ